MEEHLAGCSHCSALRDSYEKALVAMQASNLDTTVSLPAADDIVAATRARLRGRRRARWSLMAAASVAVLVPFWLLLGDSSEEFREPLEAYVQSGPLVSGSAPELTGHAVLESRDGAEALSLGSIAVQEGGTIRTDDEPAVLSDQDTASVAIGSRTRLQVVSWRPERTVLQLEAGDIELRVQNRGPGESFEVRTSLAVVKVVGTRFVVRHRAGRSTEVLGLEGQVVVETIEGELVAYVTAGRSVRLDSGVPFHGTQAIVPPRRQEISRTRDSSRAAGRPVVAEELVFEARRLLADGRDEDALGLLRRALEASTPQESPRILAALAEAYRLAGRMNEAGATWELCLASGSGSVPESAYLQYIDLLTSQGRIAEAVRVRQEYLVNWPAGHALGRVLRDLAAQKEREGLAGDALEIRRRLVRQAPRSSEAIEVFIEQGLRLVESGNLNEAADWFENQRISESRDLAEAAWVGLIRVRFEEEKWDEVASLALRYRHAFPVGSRHAEVERLVDNLPPTGDPDM
jgi:hypothetical protein